jgi:RimJ/RimL family protein N-acetyltransferase
MIREQKYTYSEDALRTMIKHLFNGVGYNRLEAFTLATNRRALALEKKVGFVKEGVSRKACKIDDQTYIDIVNLGLLKEEYRDVK